MSFLRLRRAGAAAVAVALLGVGACSYTFSGGGGLPPGVKTIYVPPVENQTTRFVLTEQLTQGLLDAARGRLGAQLAAESDADAIFQATITGYSDRAINFGARQDVGAEIFQRRITIQARVSIIEREEKRVVWSSPSVSGVGEYAPDTETEDDGQAIALENLIQKIVDGAQSQW